MLYLYPDLDAEAIVKIVNEIDDPAEAARKLVKTSAALWAEKNDYCDDITAIVIFISSDEVGSSGKVGRKQMKSRDSMLRRIQKRFAKRKKKQSQ